jgi:uncharacterized secreted protein with C-terminal beta-propeller domain
MGSQRTVLAGAVVLLVGVAVGAGATVFADGAVGPGGDQSPSAGDDRAASGLWGANDTAAVAQFESSAAFGAYVQRGRLLASGGTGVPARPGTVDPTWVTLRTTDGRAVPDRARPQSAPGGEAGGASGGADDSTAPERVSTTNVQERGLAEPDILKTDGEHVYYAGQETEYHGRERADEDTRIVDVGAPADPVQVASIDDAGDLFRTGDTLVVIERDALVGYDVSDPAAPTETWRHSLDDAVVTARLTDGTLYLVTRSTVSLSDPCPIEPLSGAAAIDCAEVYRPGRQVAVDSTYTTLSFDATDGEVRDTASFVGTRDDTAVYMSEAGLYVTYTQRAQTGALRLDFLVEEQSDRLPTWAVDRLAEIRGYDISPRAMQIEADRVLQQWYATLDADRRETVRNDVENEYRDFLADHQREVVRTGVVRVGVADGALSVESTGTVPGTPLNQFSMDEHEGTLRITTTVPAAGSAQSVNDLYVLDNESLDRVGAATGMGVNERVYSVRYVGETAYVVTFRRVDPFHVVDLSDPSDPTEVGKLKLPGFSSYLHPVDDDHVLGIGREDGAVKAVLFDVSDPSDPVVDDDYVFEARWSAVSESHHAFLLDRAHGVFFLPTSRGGQIVGYTNDTLDLETTVRTDGPAERAMYLDDYMYVFGGDDLTVVDERTWERETTLDLD